MEALRAWRASSNLIGFAASRAAASRPLGLRIRCCSAAAATTNPPPAQPQDRRRRSASSSASTSDRDSIRAIRLKKVEELRAKGHEPYAYKWDRTHTTKELQERYAHLVNGEVCEDVCVSVAGRIVARRAFGKLVFMTVRDDAGTMQVMNETLRRATILPWFSRKAAQDFSIDGYEIKKGTSVNLDVVSIHHDPSVFADPERFNPNRFDETLKPYSFLGFGSGPRMCPGMSLAKLEICVFVHHLVSRYSWKPLEDDDTVQPTLVRMPKNKYPIVATAL